MIRPVSYAEILDAPNSKQLLDEYGDECSLPELGKPSPQRDLYELLEKSGGFQAFGVYDSETLIGFAGVFIYTLPHYGAKIAATESIFITEDERSNKLYRELKAHLKSYAKENGCVAFQYTAPVGSRFARLLSLYWKTYRHTNNVYLEVL